MANIHPPLDERVQAPALIVPSFYLIFAAAALTRNIAAKLSIFILLVTLAVSSPAFKDKSLNEDYSRGLPSFTLPILFLDLLVLSSSDTVRAIRPAGDGTEQTAGVSNDDCNNFWKKLQWGMRLVSSPRGIGWSWQVKGIPPHPDKHLARTAFVLRYAILAMQSWIYKLVFHYLSGIATAGRANSTSLPAQVAFDILEGWSGAFWACVGLNQFYRMAAAVTVGVGLCDPWEWPPFFGTLKDAWSVRQTWSSVWHQLVRRVVQEPGIRLARCLGLHKGTLGSRYVQLYTAFTISMLLHEWCMFNAIHSDAGEFRFFMSQPLAITFEDFAQWCWRKFGSSERYQMVGQVIGYVWTFAWFSYCLPQFVLSQRAVGIMGGDLGAELMGSIGQRHAKRLVELQR